MSRTETIGDATLHLGDCYAFEQSVWHDHAVITDPPYGIQFEHKTLGGIANDETPPDIRGLAMSKQCIIWGGHHFTDQLPRQPRWLMWLKHDAGLFEKRDHGSFDLAWTNLGGSVRAFRNIWDGSIRQGEEFGKPSLHPTQKPIALMEWCVEMTEGPVFDPFMGSGTTGVAALRLKRPFVGIEIDPVHFDRACRRIEEALKQPRLFAGAQTKSTQGALEL